MGTGVPSVSLAVALGMWRNFRRLRRSVGDGRDPYPKHFNISFVLLF